MGKYCDNGKGLLWWKTIVMMENDCYDGKGMLWWKIIVMIEKNCYDRKGLFDGKSTKTCISEQKHR